ncbi:MAG: lysylphosphatidylglycerol synthase transmembrane domain-containing protein [Geminicoccaceae bacterium]
MSQKEPLAESVEKAAPGSRKGLWLRLVLGLGILAGIFFVVDRKAIGGILAGADPLLLVAALALFVLERVVAAMRWRMLIAGIGEAPPLSRFISLIFSSTFLAFFLPGGVGGEIFRIYGLTRGRIDMSRALASVFVERILALVALGMLILWGLANSPFSPPDAVLFAILLSFSVIAFACALVFSPAVRRLTTRLLQSGRLAKWQAGIDNLFGNFDAFLTRPGLLAYGFVFAIGFQLLRVVAVWVGALALGMDYPFALFLYAVPSVNLITQIPISIGGVGVREASFAALLGLAGVSLEAAVAISLLTYALSILAVCPGAITFARQGLRA